MSEPVLLQVDADVRPHVTPGWLVLDGVRVTDANAALDAPLDEIAARMRASADQPARTAAVRAMYRRFGVDPTRTRPSSEALLRRVRKGESLPRINTIVDICNWCSLEFQVPYGLYDLSKVDGAIVLRTGAPGESYAGISKDEVHVEGRLVLADTLGPFGNPTSDSARTMVTPDATSVLSLIFAPASIGRDELAAMLETTSTRMRQFCGGVERERAVMSVSAG